MSSGHTLKRFNLLFFSPRLRCVLDLSFAVSALEIVLNSRWKYGRHHLIGWSLHHLRPSYAQNQIGLLSSKPADPPFSCFSSSYSYKPRSAFSIPQMRARCHEFAYFVLQNKLIFSLPSFWFTWSFISFPFFFFLPRITGCWRSQDADHKRFIFCLPSEVVQNDQISLDFP